MLHRRFVVSTYDNYSMFITLGGKAMFDFVMTSNYTIKKISKSYLHYSAVYHVKKERKKKKLPRDFCAKIEFFFFLIFLHFWVLWCLNYLQIF